MASRRILDSAIGAVVGALVGDAAGAPLEFLGRLPEAAEIERALGMEGGGVWGVAPGQITDDGELTISLLRALGAAGRFDLESIAGEYRRWFASAPFDVGGTIGSTIGRAEDAAGMREAALDHVDSKANGSLMRCVPLGVWGSERPLDELAEAARLESSLSHANPSCMDAVACYVTAIALLVRGAGDGVAVFDEVRAWAGGNVCEEVRGWLALARGDADVPGTPQDGFVKIAFVHALRHLRRGTPYLDAIRSVLAIGGDTDTNACIVGGLVGASVGFAGIPEAMRRAVLESDTSLGRPRPDWLRAGHAPELVARLVGGDAAGGSDLTDRVV